MNRVEKTRKRALSEVFWQLQDIEDEEYTETDFLIDAIARVVFKLRPKLLGKPPYEDWIDEV